MLIISEHFGLIAMLVTLRIITEDGGFKKLWRWFGDIGYNDVAD